jgi:arylsulfatase A-like enzyme
MTSQDSGLPGRLCLLTITLVFAARSVLADAPRPNIVVILSDDMGYSDIGCYGGEIRTPRLDQLAAGGLRFTQFYNTARCCPTRASLLTGLYPHQAGVGHMMDDRGQPGYRGDLNTSCRTLAEVLRPAGYATYAVGKWHVTRHIAEGSPQHNWPLQRGFDRFYGTIHGAGSFYDPHTLVRDNTRISPYADPEYQPETYYYTDAISDQAARFIREHSERDATTDRPFFLYVAYTAAHWPMHALPEDIARYRGRYHAGYAAIREARLTRQIELGLLPEGTPLTPQAEEWATNDLTPWEERCMEVYAAMIDRMDQGIGRIVDQLQATGELENTLILYLQDNGGCAEGVGRGRTDDMPERADAPTLPVLSESHLQLDATPRQTRDGFPVRQGAGVMPGAADTYVAYGRGWANVSNTPFREYKHWVHEGGISTPLIAHWPNGIARHGELERAPGHLVDLLPTCLELSGAEYPAEFDGIAITPLAGRSLAPAFRGESLPDVPLYWEHEGNRGVRVGDWKLVARENQPWELYDFGRDRVELHDLSADDPQRVEELSRLWDDWAARSQVLPLGAWRGRTAEAARSTQRRFELDGTADLARSEAPDIAGRPLRLTVRIGRGGARGVLVAQGGGVHGFSLALRDGTLTFGARRNRNWSAVTGEGIQLRDGSVVEVQLARDAEAVLTVDGNEVARGRLAGLVDDLPGDGLQVGRDLGAAVGDYEPPFAFEGEVSAVIVELPE